jgi:hypothetical protein
MMNGHGKSDRPIVPKKLPNKVEAGAPAAEAMEGRGLTKGSPQEQGNLWAQNRIWVVTRAGEAREAIDRVRPVSGFKRHYPRWEPGAVIPLAGI